MTRKGIRPRKVSISLLTPIEILLQEARSLQIIGAEHFDFKELSRQIALAKTRRGD